MIDFEVWEPGNMTRYELDATKVHSAPGEKSKVALLRKNGAVISGIILTEGMTDARYISDRTGWGLADTAAILAWVVAKTARFFPRMGIMVRMPEGFNGKGLWEG